MDELASTICTQCKDRLPLRGNVYKFTYSLRKTIHSSINNHILLKLYVPTNFYIDTKIKEKIRKEING